jgi:hypothetical protein
LVAVNRENDYVSKVGPTKYQCYFPVE